VSNVGQDIIAIFIKFMRWGHFDLMGVVCGTQTGGFEVSAVLSITEVLRMVGE
jgi:hypothetical protein